MLDKVEAASAYIKEIISDTPEVGIVLGTGLGALSNEIEVSFEINYTDIPHFVLSTVEFHSGKLIFGKMSGKQVVAMQGRFHFYEGYSMQEITFPIRVLKAIGIQNLFISNAAGGINRSFRKTDIMIITDHINLQTANPLTGLSDPAYGPRFPDMFNCYAPSLIELAEKLATENKIPFQKGVYVSITGPNLETQAEYKFMEIIGADAVGMSTVPEVIVAKQMSLPVFAISCITDEAFPEIPEKVTIESVLAAAAIAEPKMTALIKKMIERI